MDSRIQDVPAEDLQTAASSNAIPIPRLRGGLPILGHALAFGRDPLALLEQAWQRLGDVFGLQLGGRQFVVLAGLAAHEAYFLAPDDQLSAREVYQFTVPIFGKGVAYDASPEVMAEQLDFLAPLLKGAPMRQYVNMMRAEAVNYTATWGDEGELDLPILTNELTMCIASRCLLGAEVRARLHSGFAQWYHDLQGGINTLGFLFPYLPTPAHRRRDRARRAVAAWISGIVSERRRTGLQSGDFMQALMDAQYANGKKLSDDAITGLLLTVLFAGQHTSAVLAAWLAIELLQHQKYLEAIIGEIRHCYGTGQEMSLETLKQQVTLERAVREGERLHPPLILLVRKALREFEYAGFRIAPGTMVMVSPALSHRLPTVFKDPHRFDPERFAPPREEHRQHAHTLIGFGGGRHRCMGTHFAYLQIKALWTVLWSRFEIELVSEAPLPDYGSWVTGPRDPCRIRYRRRAVPLGPRV